MILYELRCAQGHGFEAWFRNADAYDQQAAAGEVACPACGDTSVEKAPMAPRIAKHRRDAQEGKAEPRKERQAELMRQLAELRRHVEDNCDYVGDRFAEEARRIHYGEADERGIYGEADEKEARELEEEGIRFARIPWLPRTNS